MKNFIRILFIITLIFGFQYSSIAAEKVEYLKNNPNIEPADYLNMNIVSGVTKSEKGDSGMREVFSKIAEKHPTSPLAERYGKKSIRKIKAKRAYDKHKKRSS